MNVKLFFIATMAMLCSVLSIKADRVLPTKPTPATLESGKTYYLYNVGTEKLLGTYASNAQYAGVNVIIGRAATITKQSNDYYSIQFIDNGYYLSTSGSYCHVNQYNTINSSCYFTIEQAESGYHIRSRSYSDKYVGPTSAGRVDPDITSGNIVWELYEVSDEMPLYTSKRDLYNAIEAAEAAGYNVEREEAIYNNPASTAEELANTADRLSNGIQVSNGYSAPRWNEYPILFQPSEGTYGQNYYYTWSLLDEYNYSGSYFYRKFSNNTSTLTATVKVDKPSTFVYQLEGSTSGCNLTIYVDGVQKRYFRGNQLSYSKSSNIGSYSRFFEILEPGTHTISWKFTATGSSSCYAYIYNIGCTTTPEVSVKLSEPGSLGTEVLYGGVNHIKNVRKLKVAGAMNNADWAQIQLMDSLFEIDLSEAEITSIPANQFYGNETQSAFPFLRKVILPKSLKEIGTHSFANSHIEELIFPEECQLTTIGEGAIQNTNLYEIILPNQVSSIGEWAMWNNYYLEKVSLGKVLTSVPKYCFKEDGYIVNMILPNTITTVDEQAFYNCHLMQMDSLPANLQTINQRGFYGCDRLKIKKFPETLKSIGEEACAGWHAMDSIIIPKSISTLGERVFLNSGKLKYAELPSQCYNLPNRLFEGCPLETLVLYSASVATYNSNYLPVSTDRRGSVTLRVPNYLVNYYKQDSYWSYFKDIEGFGTELVDSWKIYRPTTLDAHNRYGGTPDVYIGESGSLKITGALPMEINNFDVSHGGGTSCGKILSNCENISIKGTCLIGYYTDASKWYFISLPFDMAVADIQPAEGMQYAIRYYDGANRAANGASGSWKNHEAGDIIPAGTGFIYQTSKSGWTGFYAVDNETKQNIVAYEEFTKMLAAHESEKTADKGWNLIGNPYQTYYNNHYMNFTAPITVRDVSKNTYVAKSLIDDDYAIGPNEAFFVQCPNEVSSVSFPLGGRQLTSVISDQNVQAKARTAHANDRQLIDILLAGHGQSDHTRIVFNEEAECGYELSCDASKFFSDDATVPQLFTVGTDGVQYAINERPVNDGTVALAFYAPEAGSYTLSVNRCDAEHVYLTDHENGTVTDLATQSYSFNAEAGNLNGRFSLSVVPGTTDIASVSERQTKVKAAAEGISISGLVGRAEVFSADGRMAAAQTLSGEEATISLPQGIYIVRAGSRAYKVVIK